MLELLSAITRNAISLAGSALALVSSVLFLVLFSIEMFGTEGHSYVGIITYLILPALFVLGLLLIALGVFRERRRSDATTFPIIDLNLDSTRRRFMAFLVLTVMNVTILATATFKGVEFMESSSFCGTTCHTVMSPEYTAYQGSPHARVACVDCHIGPGADWFVKSKLSGAWQVISTAFELYPTPIPTPVHNLRPSTGTCEQCHWPSKFHGVRPKVITRFEDDESNTELKTILLLNVGGEDVGVAQGIHWHVDPGNRVRYRSDPGRQTIYEVELTQSDGGTVKRYINDSENEEEHSEWRVMDCVDCHNRPTHIYQGAEEAVDLALHSGAIETDLPYIKREGVKAIRADYASHEEARQGIASAVAAYYETEHPELAAERATDIERAGRVLGDAYSRNVFPAMKVTWGTYPSHLGHESSPGCFRCHEGLHSTEDGETISEDCDICHSVLAWDEENPEILEMIPQ